ncbi:methyltransferase domain-containing protein [Coniochaeta sp. 2T2.1]|nr:methyltransferase domain-containing protein [Coniochaeta sp. 2T2.1]
MASKPTHLEPSELGTKQYWDALYATELTNHSSNPADEGTVWFDDSDAEARLLSFLDAHSHSDDDPTSQLRLSKPATSFLDLGCGNGSLLFALRDDGWDGRLLGVDYSEASVALAVRVGEARRRRALEEDEDEDEQDEGEGNTDGETSKSKRESHTGTQEVVADDGNAHNDKPPISAPAPDGGRKTKVDFMVWDVLAGPLDAVRSETNSHNGDASTAGWDVVLDKGTFDAVSLSSQRDGAGRRICEGYRDRVLQLLRPGGVFLVTSCNWTEAELKGWFEEGGRSEMGRLRQVDRVEYRSFSFGGVKGQTISTVCFMKE